MARYFLRAQRHPILGQDSWIDLEKIALGLQDHFLFCNADLMIPFVNTR